MSKFTMTQKKLSPLSGPAWWQPKNYQKRALKFILENACAGLLLDPGLGKTSISLALIKILKQEGMPCKTLIVAPLRPCELVWPREQQKWADFHGLSMTILHGKHKEKNLRENYDIYLINPEGLPWLLKQKKIKFNVLFVDESSQFRHTNTQRFKNMKALTPQFDRRYILTGSFVPNGLMGLFGQIFILDDGAALGRYITNYRNTYFSPSGYGGYEWKIQKGAEALIQEKIKPLTMRLEAKDHLELPQEIYNEVVVELSGEGLHAYHQMENLMFTALEGKLAVAETAAVASMKCRQIANGGLYVDDKEVFVHDLKAQAVKELVEELNGSPVLVAYEFKHDLTRLLKLLGKNTPFIGGGVSPKKSAVIADAWNRGEIPVLLAQPSAMAHGLNLQESGNHIIWHSLTWNYEHYDQFNKRIIRQGAKFKQAFIYHIVAKGTVDELVLEALRNKGATQHNFLSALKDYSANKKLEQFVNLGIYNSREIVDNLSEAKEPPRRGGPRETKKERKMSEDKPKKFAAKKAEPVTVDAKAKKIVTAKKSDAVKKLEKSAKKTATPKAAKKTSEEPKSSLTTMKIKVVNKKHDAREGSVRASIFDALLSSKTVAEAREKESKVDSGAVRLAEKLGLIELQAA